MKKFYLLIALFQVVILTHGQEQKVKIVTQFIPIYYGVSVISKSESFVEEHGLYVDDNFNEVFDFSIISGDSKSMFSEVNSIALSSL